MKPFAPSPLPLSKLDWASLVPLIGKANAALARYDGILQGIPNPDVLLSPMTTQEAVLSSRIEGTQATLEEVLEFDASPVEEGEKVEDIREIVNYRRAMRSAVATLKQRPLSLNLILQLHSKLLDSVRGRDKGRGHFRTVQNWVGSPQCPTEEATYVPPSPETLSAHLDNFEKYIHFEEKDRLVQLAFVHAQFELIHPFVDGNGRVGRMLIPLFLFEKQMLSSPNFYISAYLETNREVYYEKLRTISSQDDWNGWIRFFLTAIIEQAMANNGKARKILELYNSMKQKVPNLTRSQFSTQAIDALFNQPYFLTTGFVRQSDIPKQSAIRILKTLKANRIVETIREGRGRRGTIFAFPELIRIVEDRALPADKTSNPI
ncbi:MAG: Fic/DOC family N-terminal domain-containing protein [Planctomycetota bacterium]